MFELIISMLFLVVLMFPVLNQYSVVQSCHYEILRYFKYKKCKKVLITLLNIGLFIMSFFLSDIDKNVITVLLIFIISFAFYKKEKVKFTKRIKRFVFVYFIIGILLFSFFQQRLLLIRLISSLFIFYLVFIHFIKFKFLLIEVDFTNGHFVLGNSTGFVRTNNFAAT